MKPSREFPPGAAAPDSGQYELLNVLGSPSGTCVPVHAGDNLPGAPYGWTWRLAPEQPAG